MDALDGFETGRTQGISLNAFLSRSQAKVSPEPAVWGLSECLSLSTSESSASEPPGDNVCAAASDLLPGSG